MICYIRKIENHDNWDTTLVLYGEEPANVSDYQKVEIESIRDILN